MPSSSAICGPQQAQLLQGRQRSGKAARRPVVVHASAPPPPAWPGRVPVPETLPQRDGPKVRLLRPVAHAPDRMGCRR